MRQYLAEGISGAFPFIVDRTKAPVSESRPNGGSLTRIPGRLSVCDCVNGNNRRYSKQVWEKNLKSGSVLQDSIAKNGAFGLLEHPKDGIVTLESPISHQVTRAELIESRDPVTGKLAYEVTGEISLYNPALIPESAKLMALIEGGYNPLVSSRGYGTLEKSSDGVDEVKDDYVCEGWDIVIKPSFENAELAPDRSSTTARMAPPVSPDPQAESLINEWHMLVCPKCRVSGENVKQLPSYPGNPEKRYKCESCNWTSPDKVTAGMKKLQSNPLESKVMLPVENKQDLKESVPSPESAKPISETKKEKPMELNEIKLRLEALRNTDPAKPLRFAESMTQVEELHQAVAEWQSTDNKRSWEAQKLHKTLDGIAESFTNTVKAPAKEAKRLTEQNGKLMRVINAVAQTAVTYKKKLGETLKSDGSRIKMIEELTRRGQGWQRIAESRKQKFVTLESDFNKACEALDIMAKRYHEDVTELGRRVIVLEFKDKVQTPEMQKSLKEATRLRHIVAIREKLEGKPAKKTVQEEEAAKGKLTQPTEGEAPGKEAIKDGKQKGAGSPDQGKVAQEPGSITNESKGAPAATVNILKPSREDLSVRNINESVELVRRLSPVPAK